MRKRFWINQHLALTMAGSSTDGKLKWEELHIEIHFMQAAEPQDRKATCVIDRYDVETLIAALQQAKGLLPSDDDSIQPEPHAVPAQAQDWPTLASFVDDDFMKSKRRELFEPPKKPDMEAVCSVCGYEWGEHSGKGACIEQLPDNMRRFSKTERFTE